MARLPYMRKRQDAKPRAARYENGGRPVSCANCEREFARRRCDQMYCRRPKCRREIQRRAHAKWYGKHGVEQRAKMRQRYAADPTKAKRRQMAMYQRKKATAEDEAGANFATSLAAVYMAMGSERRGPIADDDGTPEGQAARKAGRPRASPPRRSSKSHGPAGRADETPQGTCGSWRGRVAYARPRPWRASVAVPHTVAAWGAWRAWSSACGGTDPATDTGGRTCARSLRRWVRDASRGPRIRACRSTLVPQDPSGRLRSSMLPCFMNKSSISLK